MNYDNGEWNHDVDGHGDFLEVYAELTWCDDATRFAADCEFDYDHSTIEWRDQTYDDVDRQYDGAERTTMAQQTREALDAPVTIREGMRAILTAKRDSGKVQWPDSRKVREACAAAQADHDAWELFHAGEWIAE